MMDDSERRSYLPWLMAVLILVIGGAKLDATRPILANVLAVSVPLVPAAMGVYRLSGGDASVERAASLVGGVVILAGEVCVARGFFGVGELDAVFTPARYVLYGAALAALVLDAVAFRRGVKARFAAFLGISNAFAVYLSLHPGPDPFSGVFGAFFVALALGGGVGLVAGELLGRAVKSA